MELRTIERELERRLKNSGKEGITPTEGVQYFSNYITARKKVVEEILPEIKAIENSLTDHSERHIGNVLDNIWELIGKDKKFPVMELYFLCLLALFHDVGNIHGRIGHYDKKVIYQIYNYVRGGDVVFDDEKDLVAEVASKHSGRATDGSKDTIKELSDTNEGLWGKGINLRKCAAILRFADELAEGRQRTSNFMIQYHKYDVESKIHHSYSNCSNIFISKNDSRIAIRYTLRINTNTDDAWILVEELLKYIFIRIKKINNERLYNKYYAETLSSFKKVEVGINFEVDGIPVTIGLKGLVITDLITPGSENIDDVKLLDQDYSVAHIISKLQQTAQHV